MKDNTLAKMHPELLEEWDFEKNIISPENVTCGSSKTIWWKCPDGHSYKSKISNRTMLNQGCPYCSGRFAIIGKNDLATTHPHLIKEWNTKLNSGLNPTDFKAGSNKAVWWLCNKGHAYKTKINNRALLNQNCPYCSHRKVLQGFNDLKTIRPELAAEWNYKKNATTTPEMILPFTAKKYWWKCAICGYEWNVSPNTRKCCPNCSKKITTSYPEQVIFYYVKKAFEDTIGQYQIDNEEFDIFIPSINTAIEYDGVYFHNKGFKANKDNQKDKFCKEKNIRLIRFRDPQLPETESAIIIRCKDSNYDFSLVDGLQKLFQILEIGCSEKFDIRKDKIEIVASYRKNLFENSLLFKNPDIASEWNYEKNSPLTPEQISFGSQIKVWWKCKHGHEWQATIGNRQKAGCPVCSGKKVLQGFNDLATLKPELLSEWNYEKNYPLTPDNVAKFSNKVVWWKCKNCGREWKASISNRVQGRGCKVCSKEQSAKKLSLSAVAKNGSLATNNPDKATQWDYEKNYPLIPEEVSSFSSKKVWWLCSLGHSWQSSITNRVKDNLGCPYCGNQKVLVGYNDLASKYPNLAKEWDYSKNEDLTPEMFVPGSGKKINWKCIVCGNEWEAVIRDRVKGQKKCPVCSQKNR